MKKAFLIIALVSSTFTMGCFTNELEQIEQETKNINKKVTVREFSKLIDSEKGQILDVRTPEEWAEGTIKNAIKMNFFGENFDQEISTLDKTRPIYLYCKSGGRSGKAASRLEKMGFTAVYNLDGGITAWRNAEKATEK